MCPEQNRYELSVIIPTFNEAAFIAGLLRNLAGQKDADLEVLVCDGGSADATVEKALSLAAELPFPLSVAAGEKGRGRQMNAGARAAKGEYLLFLHADSLFSDHNALNIALNTLKQVNAEGGDIPLAGRFRLRFLRTKATASFSYYFSECKARLERAGCTHGDQGFLLSRSSFMEVGPFDESCTVLEDTRFAETVRRRGRWLLFEPEILTSARRFESEGVGGRQLLNAIIMTLDYLGRDDMIRELPGIYTAQKGCGRLRLFPFLDRISGMLDGMGWRERTGFWRGTGRYLCMNAWQLPLALDARRRFRQGTPPGKGEYVWLRCFDRLLAGMLDSLPASLVASCLAWLLFRCVMLTHPAAWSGTTARPEG